MTLPDQSDTEPNVTSEIGIVKGKVIVRFPEAKIPSGDIAVVGYTPAEAIACAIELIRYADKASGNRVGQ